MKDFQLRNDTKLLYRSDPVEDIAGYVKGKRVLFVYGGGSVKKNGCYDDVKQAVSDGNGEFMSFPAHQGNCPILNAASRWSEIITSS